MKVRWSESALADIKDIFAYIHERNRSAAAAVVERIESIVALLEEFPEAGHRTDEPNVRMFPVVRYPYLIFYVVDEPAGEVVIVHVRHAAQERP